MVYQEETINYPDDTIASFRKPFYSIESLGYGVLDANTKISPIVANHVIGLVMMETDLFD